MAVVELENIMERVRKLAEDPEGDMALSLYEDITDTFAGVSSGDIEKKIKELEDTIETLKKEKEDLDASWRKKYSDRFFGGADENNDDTPPQSTETEIQEDSEEKLEEMVEFIRNGGEM